VPVPSTGIRLPNLQQGLGNRLLIFIEYAAAHKDSRTDRFATIGKSHIVIALRYYVVAEDRSG
jgi:hypothetical protein